MPPDIVVVTDSAPDEAPSENVETAHVVSLEERLGECLQRLALVEERLSQTASEVSSAEVTAEIALSAAVAAEETAQAAGEEAALLGAELAAEEEPAVSVEVVEPDPPAEEKSDPPTNPRSGKFLGLR